MKLLAALAATVATVAGCGDAFLVRPIYYQEGLQERVVDDSDSLWTWNKVLVLDVDGLIANAPTGGWFTMGENPVSLLKEKLQMAEADSYVGAVILRINSPGGTVTASDIMYREVKAFRERTGRPVVALLMDVAASGGYYTACAADKIVAHPTTLTGSIGVLMQWMNFAGTMALVQLQVETIKSGDKKDIASPFRFMTAEERKMLQEIVNTYHENFVRVVADARKNLTVEQVRKLADGSVFEAGKARQLGLVDEVGYMEDAFRLAKTMGKMSRAKVVAYSRQFQPHNTVYAQGPSPPSQVNLVNVDLRWLAAAQQPQFLYLWAPGVGSVP